jgi:hypothetical protein
MKQVIIYTDGGIALRANRVDGPARSPLVRQSLGDAKAPPVYAEETL